METSQRISDSNDDGYAPPAGMPAVVSWLQGINRVWMLMENRRLGINHPVRLKCHRPQLHSTKQLRVRRDDDGGETHCDCPNAHGHIESPTDEEARCHRDGRGW